MEKYAPIILFVYNRVDHAKRVIEALQKCPESIHSRLYIYSDAAKNGEAIKGVSEVRKYIHSINGFRDVVIEERKENWGIEKSEIDAISTIINKFGKTIILEDDIVVGPYFLKFMNEMLLRYEEEKRIYSITGYSYIDENLVNKLPEYAFTQFTSAWGWATWADRWSTLINKIDDSEIKKLCDNAFRDKFDCGYCFSEMLYEQYKKQYITWDIKWYWTSFVHDGLTLFPVRSMINNIGMDGSGVHYTDSNYNAIIKNINFNYTDNYPISLEENDDVNNAIKASLMNLLKRDRSLIKNMICKLNDLFIWKLRAHRL